jgi:outer membrane murein-binding lipoprotein Lpp
MIWWISLGGVGLGLVLLVLVVLPVLRRLAGLRRAMIRAEQRAAQVQGLQASVEALQERLAEVAERAAAARPGVVVTPPGRGDGTTFASGE